MLFLLLLHKATMQEQGRKCLPKKIGKVLPPHQGPKMTWGRASSAALMALSALAGLVSARTSRKASADNFGPATPTETPEKPDTPLLLIERRAQRVCNRSRSQARQYVQTHKALSGFNDAQR